MKAIKRLVCALLLCVSVLAALPTVQADAAGASNTVEIGYWAQPTIDKGDPVQTGDSADLYQYFVLLSLSTFSLFLLLILNRRKEKEENN